MTPRETILERYKQLVTQYHAADYLFEQNEGTDDDELFNHYWLAVTKAHMHMQQYAEKHKISRQELTESSQGVRCSSVQELMGKVSELLGER